MADAAPHATPARVARVDKGQCTLLAADGPMRATTSRHAEVAVGDWAAVEPPLPHGPDDLPRVTHVLPRRSAFLRSSAGEETRAQVVATNVDHVLIVNGLDVRLSLRRIERYLAMAWQSGASPVIVLTKADLVERAELLDMVAAVESVALGVPVHVVAADDAHSLEVLDEYVRPGRTMALLGSSGAGKSTLVNRLAGSDVAVTGEVRSDGKGRHTTTHRELLVLPAGGLVIDTPGMRGIALWGADEGVEQAFTDVADLAGQCRFNDCTHEREPGCEVLAAVADGRLDAARLEGWRKLQRELEHLATRQDARLRAEKLRQWKSITKAQRNRPG
ncbi:MAG: ribosome biosis GTPase / thiamine phosphate phosphatase [Acidimicrobiaceae bacterium]|nr:ribosome biosis GTPase / thiamine phosphate phosphatase [Acidimicrobiaceae bacterium]